MRCPRCNTETYVIDSRPTPADEIRRRRQCPECKYRFTTYEITSVAKAILEQGVRMYERKNN